MNLPTIATVSRQPFTPGAQDAMGLRPEGWGTAAPVSCHGWWPPSPEQILGVEPGRRATEIQIALIVPQGTTCADRDRWTLPVGTFEQVAGAQDYSHGPFGTQVPLIVYLKRVDG